MTWGNNSSESSKSVCVVNWRDSNNEFWTNQIPSHTRPTNSVQEKFRNFILCGFTINLIILFVLGWLSDCKSATPRTSHVTIIKSRLISSSRTSQSSGYSWIQIFFVNVNLLFKYHLSLHFCLSGSHLSDAWNALPSLNHVPTQTTHSFWINLSGSKRKHVKG